jgi:hypothetical protein
MYDSHEPLFGVIESIHHAIREHDLRNPVSIEVRERINGSARRHDQRPLHCAIRTHLDENMFDAAPRGRTIRRCDNFRLTVAIYVADATEARRAGQGHRESREPGAVCAHSDDLACIGVVGRDDQFRDAVEIEICCDWGADA